MGGMYRFVDRKRKYCDASVHRWIVTPLLYIAKTLISSYPFIIQSNNIVCSVF